MFSALTATVLSFVILVIITRSVLQTYNNYNFLSVMVRIISCLVFLSLCYNSHSQNYANDSLTTIAYWEEGEIYKYQLNKLNYEDKDGVITENKSTSKISMEIISETDSNYIINYKIDRIDGDDTSKGQFENPLPDFIQTQLVYEIETDENGAYIGIRNWRELQSSLSNLLELGQGAIEDLSTEERAEMQKTMNMMFDSRGKIETMFAKNFNILFENYGYVFDTKDTTEYEQVLPNNFGGEPFPQEGKIFFDVTKVGVDNSITLHDHSSIDEEIGKKAIIDILKKIAPDSQKDIDKGLADVAFNISDSKVQEFDVNYGHLIYALMERTVIANDLTSKSKRIEKTEYTLLDIIEPTETEEEQTMELGTDSNFEGRIIYDMKMEDKSNEMTPEQMKMFMGSEQTYTVKDQMYMTEMNGLLKMKQYYLGTDTMYLLIAGVPNLSWIDVSYEEDEIMDYKIDKAAKTINGINCDLMTITSKEGTSTYYYNSDLIKIDPASYANHKYGFWDFFVAKTHTLPLSGTVDDKDVKIEINLKDIKRMPISEREFKLPNLPRVESPDR